MFVRVIIPPAPIVTWEEAFRHLRVEDAEEKDYVEALVAAATGWIDGPAGWLGRALGPQLLEYVGWVGCLQPVLPIGNVLEVDSISTETSDGAVSPVDAETYRLRDGRLIITEGAGWVSQPVHRVRYWAGYGKRTQDDNGWLAEVPPPIKQAILLLVGHWFANREEVVTGTITAQVPMAAEALLSTYRVYS